MSARSTFAITNKTRGIVPRFAYEDIKKEVLGSAYDLSVALLTPSAMRQAMVYKKVPPLQKDLASNVLAFALSKKSGEILLCPATARTQAKQFNMDAKTFVAYLFIHGLLHLKGHDHSATMESIERQVMRRFDLRANDSRKTDR